MNGRPRLEKASDATSNAQAARSPVLSLRSRHSSAAMPQLIEPLKASWKGNSRSIHEAPKKSSGRAAASASQAPTRRRIQTKTKAMLSTYMSVDTTWNGRCESIPNAASRSL